MRQDEGEGTSVSDIMFSMGTVNNPPVFFNNATYRNEQSKNLIVAEELKPLETGALIFTFPGPGILTGLNSDMDMTT